ncbi:MAG: MFS transporter [Actinomycetia bacterium]|nr:MFS transporter [Actinomycetes bacterium]
MRSHHAKLIVLSLVPFIMVLGNSMLIPVLPKMMQVMHLNLLQAGLVITAFSIPAGIVIPLAGALSDRVGRKVVMTPALAVYGLGGLGAGVAAWLSPHAYGFILAARILQGIGAGGTYQLAMAVAGDMFQDRSRAQALGLLEAANGLGKVVSPIAGSALALIIWFAPFFAYGILSFPIAAAIWFIIQEPHAKPSEGPLRRYVARLGDTFRQKGAAIGVTFLAGSVVLFILFGVLSYLADVLEKFYGVAEFSRGLFIAVPVLASAVTSYVSGTVLQKRLARWSRPVLTGGLGLIAAAMVAEALIFNPYWALFALVAQGVGTGATLPAVNTLVTSATSTAERGVVTSLYGSVRFFGVALGPPLFAWAMTQRLAVFLGAAVLAALTAVLAWWLVETDALLPDALQKPAKAARSRPRAGIR